LICRSAALEGVFLNTVIGFPIIRQINAFSYPAAAHGIIPKERR